MTRFLTSQEFIARVGDDEALQIAGTGYDNSALGRVIDETKIESAARFADDLINGYVIGRHPWLEGVAVAAVPDLLKGLACDITRYRLRDEHINRSLITETVQTRYRDALQTLRDIQKGVLALATDAALAGSATLDVAGGNSNSAKISGPAGRAEQILHGWLL